jgi:hypothetical protein
LHDFVAHHGDVGRGAAEGDDPEAKEERRDFGEGAGWRSGHGVIVVNEALTGSRE